MGCTPCPQLGGVRHQQPGEFQRFTRAVHARCGGVLREQFAGQGLTEPQGDAFLQHAGWTLSPSGAEQVNDLVRELLAGMVLAGDRGRQLDQHVLLAGERVEEARVSGAEAGVHDRPCRTSRAEQALRLSQVQSQQPPEFDRLPLTKVPVGAA